MRFWIVLVLLMPLATAGVMQRQDVSTDLGSQTGPATLAAGDIGAPSIGASATSATVTLGSLPLITANDILILESTNDGWQVHAELVSQSGWSVLESITVSLTDGVLTEPQVSITLGSVTQTVGDPVDLPEVGFDTEIRVIGTGKGSVTFDLVLAPDAGGAELRYRVVLNVT